jgi:putative effector of murein hydrolase
MNKKTAVLNYIMRRQRNRRIKIILVAIAIAGLMGWALTYSQQQAFSLTPAAAPSVTQESTTTSDDVKTTEQ